VPEVVCIGGACIDRKYHALFDVRRGTSNPARAERAFGGVARNVAENLARLGADTALLCAVGDDDYAADLLAHARTAGIDVSLAVRKPGASTPEYVAVVDAGGELVLGMSDMRAIDALQIVDLERARAAIAACAWVFLDCNVPEDVIAWCVSQARSSKFALAIDAVSEAKVRRLPRELHGVDLLVLNEQEAAAYLQADLTADESVRALRERGAAAAILTRGTQGALVCAQTCTAVPAVTAACVDVTGAGDALIAAVIYRLLQGDGVADAARAGSLCAALTVESRATVRPDLSAALLQQHAYRLPACAST
jgi:pseudouridine kinase